MASIHKDELGEWLSAYVDGELSADQAALVERVLAEDADARRLLEELRATRHLVASLPRHAAPASIVDDLHRHIERDELLGEPGTASDVARPRRRWNGRPLAAAAIILLLVGGGTWLYTLLSRRPGATDRNMVVRHDEPPSEDAALRRKMEPATRRNSPNKSKDAPPPPVAASKEPPAAPPTAQPERGKTAEKVAADATPQLVDRLHTLGYVGRDDKAGALARVANLDQKLAADWSAPELLDHNFGNEANRVSIAVGNAADAEQVRGQFAKYCVERQIVDLREASTKKGGAPDAQSFFIEGRAGVNYTGPGGNQVLVRVPIEEVPGLVTQLAEAAPPAPDATELRFGPVSARGRSGAERLAWQIVSPDAMEPADADMPAESADMLTDGEAGTAGGAAVADAFSGAAAEAKQVEALLGMLGLDRGGRGRQAERDADDGAAPAADSGARKEPPPAVASAEKQPGEEVRAAAPAEALRKDASAAGAETKGQDEARKGQDEKVAVGESPATGSPAPTSAPPRSAGAAVDATQSTATTTTTKGPAPPATKTAKGEPAGDELKHDHEDKAAFALKKEKEPGEKAGAEGVKVAEVKPGDPAKPSQAAAPGEADKSLLARRLEALQQAPPPSGDGANTDARARDGWRSDDKVELRRGAGPAPSAAAQRIANARQKRALQAGRPDQTREQPGGPAPGQVQEFVTLIIQLIAPEEPAEPEPAKDQQPAEAKPGGASRRGDK